MSAAEKYANNTSGNATASTLNGGISSGATSLAVNSATFYPPVPQFRIIIDSEIFLVTGVSGTTFTVLPGQEGTTQASHSNAAPVAHLATAGVMQRLPTKGRVSARASGNIIM